MASEFKNISSPLSTVNTSAADVYTAPASTKGVVHALYIANKSPVFFANVDLMATTDDGTTFRHIGKSVRIAPENTLIYDKPINLEAGDKLRLVSLIDSVKDCDSYGITTAGNQTMYSIGGTGYRFYVDGESKGQTSGDALKLVKGRSYIFYQDDKSNNGYPLFFSSSTSNAEANEVTSGVTYYLDKKMVMRSKYVSDFDKAAYRYIKYTPAATGTYYAAAWTTDSTDGIGQGFEITVSETNEDIEFFASILEVS